MVAASVCNNIELLELCHRLDSTGDGDEVRGWRDSNKRNHYGAGCYLDIMNEWKRVSMSAWPYYVRPQGQLDSC